MYSTVKDTQPPVMHMIQGVRAKGATSGLHRYKNLTVQVGNLLRMLVSLGGRVDMLHRVDCPSTYPRGTIGYEIYEH